MCILLFDLNAFIGNSLCLLTGTLKVFILDQLCNTLTCFVCSLFLVRSSDVAVES